jgi:hypothetical protein
MRVRAARNLHLGIQLVVRPAQCLLLVALLTCCATKYRNDLPSDFDGHPWGERLTKFDDLEEQTQSTIGAGSCYLPVPSQISVYFKHHESFSFPGVKPSQVNYYFCYRGIAPEFCGTVVTFQSEEFDLAPHPRTPDDLTTFERLEAELLRRYGPPHRGTIPHARVKVISNEGLVIPGVTQPQRISWCGIGDRHAPQSCSLTLLLLYEPVMGEGWLVYATPQLASAVTEWQQHDAYPDDLYTLLFQYAKREDMPVWRGCTARDIQHPIGSFPLGPPPDSRQHDHSEQVLDAAAYSQGEVREVPRRHLTLHEAFTEIDFADSQLDQYRASVDPRLNAYWSGYREGVAHAYTGGIEQTLDVHQKWLRAREASSSYLQEFSLGYRDGLQLRRNAPVPLTESEKRSEAWAAQRAAVQETDSEEDLHSEAESTP